MWLAIGLWKGARPEPVLSPAEGLVLNLLKGLSRALAFPDIGTFGALRMHSKQYL
jgi:hypothetical protein